MICNDLSEMVLELRILLHDKVAIQKFNKHKLMKQGDGVDPILLFVCQFDYHIHLITLK
jgi:hypothetical protein